MIYVCSDWHFNHAKDFVYKPRGFQSVEEMNETIISNHNAVVGKDDIVYFLGDCWLGDNAKLKETIERLNGTIYVAAGNHDTDRRLDILRKCWNVREIELAYRIKYKKYHFYLSHYPTLVCNNENKIWSIHGHTHSQYNFGAAPHCFNVCMDATNNSPVSLDYVIQQIQSKED